MTHPSGLDFSGKTVIVTGGGSGIGWETVKSFRRVGADCFAVDLEFPQNQLPTYEISADVTDRRAVGEVEQELIAQTGSDRVDVLVDAAGILVRCSFGEDGFESSWDRTLDVNVTVAMRFNRGLQRSLSASEEAIVNVCSVQSFLHLPNSVTYSTSKGALAQLTRAVAVELGPARVRCNAVAPGAIEMSMTNKTLHGSFKDKLLAQTPNCRIGQPSDVVFPIVFRNSPLSLHIADVVLPVDGGFLVN